MKVLDGIRVLDMGNFITAPLAAMMLAELGADVIKIERPGQGDPFRSFKDGNYSPQFQAHNRNKRSLTLDYTQPQGRDVFDRLVAEADVLLINIRPGVEKKLGVDYHRLHELNLRSYTVRSPASAAAAPTRAGLHTTTSVSRPPGGCHCFIKEVTRELQGRRFPMLGRNARLRRGSGSLVERSRSGMGRKVEVSMLEAMIATATEPLGTFFATGNYPDIYGRAAVSQSYVLTCRDGGRIGLHLSSPDKFWRNLVAAIEEPDLLTAFPARADRISRYDELARALSEIFARRDRADWIDRLTGHDIPFASENRLSDLEGDPQVQHLNVFYSIDHPRYGSIRAPHRPIRYDGDNRSDFLPPPELGEHNAEVLRGLGMSEQEISQLRKDGVI